MAIRVTIANECVHGRVKPHYLCEGVLEDEWPSPHSEANCLCEGGVKIRLPDAVVRGMMVFLAQVDEKMAELDGSDEFATQPPSG